MTTIGEVKRDSQSRKRAWTACEICGKERWVKLRQGRPESCKCKSCGTRYKGGKRDKYGYLMIKLPPSDFFYPMAQSGGYVFEHRLVVAKAMGRCLHRWEIVHHKHAKYPAGSVEDKQDNRYPENLQLVTDDRHKQITYLEQRIGFLEKRVMLLEVENIALKTETGASSSFKG